MTENQKTKRIYSALKQQRNQITTNWHINMPQTGILTGDLNGPGSI